MSKADFSQVNDAQVAEVVAAHPLAWVFAPTHAFGTAAPVLLDGHADPARLVGHLPTRHALTSAFAQGCSATFLFQGPHGYISPSWLSNRSHAPSWNFVSVQYLAEVELVDDAQFLRHHLDQLCRATEAGRADAWSLSELGSRYGELAPRVTAFRGQIVDRQVKFKLGQDETGTARREIIDALQAEGAHALAAWMRRVNQTGRG